MLLMARIKNSTVWHDHAQIIMSTELGATVSSLIDKQQHFEVRTDDEKFSLSRPTILSIALCLYYIDLIN